ncbi:hypothetical protein LXA43DRAFT_208458 [Ganoderma leucocontextum]|nr:hypothetical protein LXA43DRAFT_208458 [Ganoderma leucocontextum]
MTVLATPVVLQTHGANMTGLNFDILREICGLLTDVPAVLSFSLSCSTLHPVAVERRLSMRAITLTSAKSVRDLHNYIFVDEKWRGQHVRAISIPGYGELPRSSEELVDRLIAVFESTPRVHALSYCMPTRPQSPFRHRRFLAAVAKMASLQELDVDAPFGLAVDLLVSNWFHALKTFRYSIMKFVEYKGSFSFLCITPWMRSTLEEIELSLEFLALAAKERVLFLAVRSVTLTKVWDFLPLDLLLSVFPNLDRTLIVKEEVFLVGADWHDHLVTVRAENREYAQKMRTWKALDRVVAGPDMLHSLGFPCPIRHLTLSMLWNDDHECRASAGNAHAVLREHAPTHLALVNVRLPHGFSNLEDLLSPEEAVPRLTHLVLDAAYENSTMPYDPIHGVYGTTNFSSWDAMLDALLVGLEALHLTHIRIIVHCQVDLGYAFCAPLYDSAHSFKFDRLVAALPGIVPSLTHIFITSYGRTYTVDGPREYASRRSTEERWGMSRGWRVRRLSHDSGTQGIMHDLEELRAEDAEAVINSEEMYATERNKDHTSKTVDRKAKIG